MRILPGEKGYIKPGDDPTMICGERSNDNMFICTRAPNHRGNRHAAHGMNNSMVHTWLGKAKEDSK